MSPKFDDRGLQAAFWMLVALGTFFLVYDGRQFLAGGDGNVIVVVPLVMYAMAAMIYVVDVHERNCESCQRNKKELEEFDRRCGSCGQRLPEE